MPLPDPKPDATYQDVLDAPEHMIAEIINGHLELSPRPSGQHGRPATRLTVALGGYDNDGGDGEEPGGWYFLFEPELHLGREILVPDLAAWRRSRLPEDILGPYTIVAPDWVCEISSPGTASRDRIVKMRLYHAAGVQFVWLVDPVAELIEVYQRDGASWRRLAAVGENDIARLPPFDAVEIDLGKLWR